MSNSSGGGGPREVDEDGEKVQPKCPYAVLAVAPSATLDDIQRSYKHLSRAFHPDKQPDPGKREDAQATFVEFKVAHDILVDPVLRQAYDDHGHYGVYFVKRSMNSSDPNSTPFGNWFDFIRSASEKRRSRSLMKRSNSMSISTCHPKLMLRDQLNFDVQCSILPS